MHQYRTKILLYTLVVIFGLLSALPSVLPKTVIERLPAWYAQNQIVLGLDLRGGSHLLLSVGIDELAIDRTLQHADALTLELRQLGISYEQPRKTASGASITLNKESEQKAALRVARLFSNQNSVMQFDVSYSGMTLYLAPTEKTLQNLTRDAAERSVEVIRRRLNETGIVEPSITRQGEDGVLVQLPGVSDPARIRELLGTTARLTFHRVIETGHSATSAVMIAPGPLPSDRMRLEQRSLLEGAHLSDARLGFDQTTGEPLVTFRLDKYGAKRFADITKENIGRALAVVLDGRVITAPVIRGIIGGGAGEISGGFSVAEAKDLALLLRAGSLPAPLKVVEERTVGPDLGSDAIQMGVTTGFAGLILVFAVMLALYGRWGFIANIALSLNIGLTLGVLSMLGATLTLPGIAGFILSIGMAVDANILINERIREETRKRSSALAALDAGFKRAYSTILDSNVTTLIAISLLFLFGAGPIRGFAVAMAIGLMTSMFTAIAVTRLLMEWRIRRQPRNPLVISGVFSIKPMDSIAPVPFMRARRVGLVLSAVLSFASLALVVYPGLDKGIDFEGGNVIEISTRADLAPETLRDRLQGAGFDELSIQQFNSPGNFMIRLPLQNIDDAASGGAVEQIKQVVFDLDEQASVLRVEIVGPKISSAFTDASIVAVLLASVGMFIYLWVRFELHFAIAALLTLVLDLTKTLGFFVLVGVEFNLTAITALLALIGYSVNDKVVVFDRVRELLRAGETVSLQRLMDVSITSTLTRTIFTSATTFLALLPMGVAGGAAVASFALPMLFGVLVGTSSSIFIATPILLLLAKRRRRKGLPLISDTGNDAGSEACRYPGVAGR